jgi:hypothetical protein
MGQRLQMPTRITSYSYPQLAQRLRPISAEIPEANVDIIYDTQTYVAAGVARLSFFANVNADATLSNMEMAGALPADVFFDVYRIFCDAHRIPTATVANTAAGAANDIATLLHIARGTFSFSTLSKPVGPIPMTFLGNSGSVEPTLGSGRADAAGAIIQFGRMPDNGGWPANGSIRLGPQTKFSVTLDFVAGTAIAVDTPLRISFLGVRYRRIG